jgi:hypothetical protein
MTLNDMRLCAAKTLSHFIQTMPDVPFTEDDILIEFARGANIVERVKALCKEYLPEIIINESQYRDLEENVFANALIGRDKSVVIVRSDARMRKSDFEIAIWHEFMHIFCAKAEIDGEHFIDIYGTGTMPDLEDKDYEGIMSAGHVVWSEFIAQYYALQEMCKDSFRFADIKASVREFLNEVTNDNIVAAKPIFAQLCAYWLNSSNGKEAMLKLDTPGFFIDSSSPYGDGLKEALYNCLVLLYNKTCDEKPWKITAEFIEELGDRYLDVRGMNSLFLAS